MHSMEPLFSVGDRVRIKTREELEREFDVKDDFIETPCHFIGRMFRFCGSEMDVIAVHKHSDGESFYYSLAGGDGWSYDECVLDYANSEDLNLDATQPAMSYDDLFN